MARKKKETVVSTDPVTDTAVTVSELPAAIPVETPHSDAPVAEAQPIETPVTAGRITPPIQPTNGQGPKRPIASFRTSSDRSTSIEVSVWSNTHRTADGHEFEQLSLTIQRSYRDATGTWVKGGSFRSHDIPVLLFLLQKAYVLALDRRTDDSSIPF